MIPRKTKIPPMSEPVEIRKDTYIAKLIDNWIPLPEKLIAKLGWKEGEELECIQLMNGQVILRKKGAMSDEHTE